MNARVKEKPPVNDPFAGLSDMLGGGLDPLAASGDQQCVLPLDQIVINRQIRKQFDDAELSIEELAASIKRHGVLQPIRVRPLPDGRWELVAGERRVRASKLAELAEIPVIWREMSDEEAEDAQLAENIHRENLKQVETAKKIQKDLDSGLRVEEVMEKHSVSRSWISKLTGLLKLPAETQRLVTAGLTSDVEAINKVKQIEKVDPQAAKELVDRVAKAGKGKVNVRDEAEKVRKEVKPSKKADADKKPGQGKSGNVATPRDRSAEQPGEVSDDAGEGGTPRFSPTEALNRAYAGIAEHGAHAKMTWEQMAEDDRKFCEEHLRTYYKAGSKATPPEVLRHVAKGLRNGSFAKSGDAFYALMAFLMGVDGDAKFSMVEILATAKA